jgi:hypothetical protein
LCLAACSSASNPSNGPPAVAADEVPTPTETASAPQATPPPQQAVPQATPPPNVSFPQTCNEIARDLETLTRQFPQLVNYRAADQKDCHVSYEYKTLPPSGRGGGWSAGVPRPEAGGVFLYIGIWDPNAKDNRQLDTQPMTGDWVIGDRRVTFILLEGDTVKSAGTAIRRLLERHGMRLAHTP